jgi:hypothetical protein
MALRPVIIVQSDWLTPGGRLIWCVMAGLFRSRAALQAEILVLRQQLIVLRRKSPKRLVFSNIDRLVLVSLYRFSPKTLDALKILKPATVIPGIALASEPIGVGNRGRVAAGQQCPPKFGSLSER